VVGVDRAGSLDISMNLVGVDHPAGHTPRAMIRAGGVPDQFADLEEMQEFRVWARAASAAASMGPPVGARKTVRALRETPCRRGASLYEDGPRVTRPGGRPTSRRATGICVHE
jgi:hypothetical protein